jgi:DNA-binding transcriptional regulator GbsR (MarR family)
MGQQEVYAILEKANKPMSLQEIAQALGYNIIARQAYKPVSLAIKVMLKYNEIKAIEIDRTQAKKYGCKRRIRLYFV